MNTVRITNDSTQQIHVCQRDFQGNSIGGTTTYLSPGESVSYEVRPDNQTVIGALTPRGADDKQE